MEFLNSDAVLHSTAGINLSNGCFRDIRKSEMSYSSNGCTSGNTGRGRKQNDFTAHNSRRVELMRERYARGLDLYTGLKVEQES